MAHVFTRDWLALFFGYAEKVLQGSFSTQGGVLPSCSTAPHFIISKHCGGGNRTSFATSVLQVLGVITTSQCLSMEFLLVFHVVYLLYTTAGSC